MANQEFPLFALHRGATLLGDAMMPQRPRRPAARAGHRPRPRTATAQACSTGSMRGSGGSASAPTKPISRSRRTCSSSSRRMRALERGVGSRYY